MKDTYKNQVTLLIDILLEVAKENNFALHGGTAINLFHLNMPRLSVDIDLTFIPFSFVSANPNWKIFDYSKYPAIKWKQLNISKLKQENPVKFRESIKKLENLWER